MRGCSYSHLTSIRAMDLARLRQDLTEGVGHVAMATIIQPSTCRSLSIPETLAYIDC